jgi:hypothetical protein
MSDEDTCLPEPFDPAEHASGHRGRLPSTVNNSLICLCVCMVFVGG